MLLAYLVPSLLSLIAVQTWFEPGTTIATADLPPPIAPEAGYTSHWSHLTAGEGAPTYDIANLPWAAWLDAWTWLGASEELGQRLWLSLLFAGSAASVVFLAFGFTRNALAAGTAGLLASFSAYRLIYGPDSIPMAAILVSALLGGLVLRAALRPERRPSVVAFALASLPLGFVMSNPPHVVIVTLWIAICVAIALVAEPSAARRTFVYLGKAVPLALLFNAWWIVPAWLTVTGPALDDRLTATGVDEWAWTHERASFLNALTLNTTWAWDYPEYYPYADGLDSPSMEILKFALPLLAAVGVVLAARRHRRIAVGLAVVALVAAWLSTGLSAPAPGVNRWLYDSFPGYWLFRDPSKLLLLVALPLAILAGLGLSRLLTGSGRFGRAPRLGAALVLGALIYVYPLYTGEVIADERPLLPSAHVRVPEAWREVATTLNARSDSGKVLILPRSDYYQVPTTWGYYGASFTRFAIRRPVLESQSVGYFRPVPSVATYHESIERDLLNGRPAETRKKLAALGVRYLLLRRDIDLTFPNRRIARPKDLAAGIRRIPGVRLVRSFGPLDLYRTGPPAAAEVFPATPALYAGPDETLANATIVSPGQPGFVSEQEDQQALVESGARPERLIRFEEDRIRRLAVKRQARTLRLRLADPFRLTVGRRTLRGFPTEAVSVPIARDTPALVTAGSAVIPLPRATNQWQELGLHGLRAREAVSVWQLTNGRSIDPASGGPVRDCNASDDLDAEEAGLRASIVPRAGRRTLRLSARAHSACLGFPLVSGRSRDIYTVRFRYRSVRGNVARACLWQSGVDRCAPARALGGSPTWEGSEATIQPDPRVTGLTLFVYADGPARGPATVTEYQGIRLQRYRRAAVVPRTTARIAALRGNAPTPGTLAYSAPPLPPAIDVEKAGPVGDCHRYDERTPRQVGIRARVVRQSGTPVLQLAARDHAACVNFAIASDEPLARTYRIQFEYRRVSGSRPRVCLWQEGIDRCASLARLQGEGDWRVFDETVELDDDADAVRLFLYADGRGDSMTVTEYRNIQVGPIASVALVGLTKDKPLPQIVALREASWRFHVQVTNARAPFLLATSEAFAPGWKASAEGRDDSALRHVEVNGYANGWLVPWQGSYEMTLEYEPERYARAARWLSIFALIGAFGWIALRRIPRPSFMRLDHR